MLRSYALLLLGALCASQAVIFINLSTMPAAALSGWRCLLAALILSPAYLWAARKHPEQGGWTALRRAALPGFMMGLHLITWTLGSRETLISNAILIICMVPLVMPVVIMLLIRERITRYELAGTIVAFIGILVLTADGLMVDWSTLRGDLICLLSMLCYCLYLALARANRDISSVWLYIPPLYLTAGSTSLFVAAVAGPRQEFWWMTWNAQEIFWLLCMVAIPTIIGHTLLNQAMRSLRSQLVAIGNLSQVGFATLAGWLVFGQLPKSVFYITLVLLIAGMAISMFGLLRQSQRWRQLAERFRPASARDA